MASRSASPSVAVPVAGNAPISARMMVVLPAPLRPIKPHISPSPIRSETLRMIGIGPIETLRPATSSIRRLHLRAHRPADERLHLGVGENLLRPGIGDHGAVVESKHAVREAAD